MRSRDRFVCLLVTLVTSVLAIDSPVRADAPGYAHIFWHVINGYVGLVIGFQVMQWFHAARREREKQLADWGEGGSDGAT